jgi:hypothetical protein
MKKVVNRKSLLVVGMTLFMGMCYNPSTVGAGIEIGNTYVNPNGLFKTVYPKDWTVVENGDSARFSPQISLNGKSALFQVETLDRFQGETLAELESHVQGLHTDFQIKAVIRNGAPGFTVNLRSSVLDYLLGKNGKAYRVASTSPTRVPKIDEGTKVVQGKLQFLLESEILN